MIGENIRRIREQRGMSISELALKADISKSYLSNIERNKNINPSIHVLDRIAVVLNVDLRTLMDIKSNKFIPNTMLDIEWVEFVEELQQLGIEKVKRKELKMIIEFIKWQSKLTTPNDPTTER